ncbi:hypothetical protein [Nocardioides salarius]|uniref:hypothetical protein n=1 Tax=Nocardioides salarius TaxID=374513 RepID=UPI0030F5C992
MPGPPSHRPRPSRISGQRTPRPAAAPKRRGRPLQLPDDPSPMRGAGFDAAARTAWLISTSRSLSGDPQHAQRAGFVEALRECGVAADPTRLSRWETGAQAVPAKALLGYERVLGLPEVSLLAAQRGLLRSSDPAAPNPDPVQLAALDVPDDRFAARLLERLCEPSERLHGGDWMRLALELTRFEMVLLPRTTWDTLCRRLVNELARTTGPDRLRRYEAAVTLITHPIAQRHVVRALGEWLTEPAVQVVSPLLPLLQHVPDEQASKLVLRLLDSDNSAISHGAVQVAAAKSARGHFRGGALALLEQRAIRELLTPQGQSGIDLLDLVAHLPAASHQTVIETVRDAQTRGRLEHARDTRCLLPADVARTLSRNIAQRAQAVTPSPYAAEPDQLLQRLVREALFHVHGSRRAMAVHLLSASPYRDAVAEGCLSLATGESHFVSARAWEAVWLLGVGSRRAEVAAMAGDTQLAWVQRRALTTLGMVGEPLSPTEARQVADVARRTQHTGVRSAALMALGNGAPSHLHQMDSLPPADRALAAWWLGVGPALRDADAGEAEDQTDAG